MEIETRMFLEMKVIAHLSKMIFDLIVPRNEGSGGSNEILVGGWVKGVGLII